MQLSRDTLFHLTHLDGPALHPSCCKGEVLGSCPSNCFTGLHNSTLFGSFGDILFYCLYFPYSPPFPTDSLMAFSSSHLNRLKRLPSITNKAIWIRHSLPWTPVTASYLTTYSQESSLLCEADSTASISLMTSSQTVKYVLNSDYYSLIKYWMKY